MKLTPFYACHRALNSEMITAGGGFQLPLRYTDTKEEYFAVRRRVGINDLSHMGEIDIKGRDAFRLVQQLIVNDLRKISDNQLIYTTMCNENGGIIDDITVYRFTGEHFVMVTNAVPHADDIKWLRSHAEGLDAHITDISSGLALATVQGPRSRDLLRKVTNIDLGKISFFNFVEGQISNIPLILSRSGYSGELGYELYIGAESAVELWNLIVTEGAKYELLPYGLGALQIHRLEKRYLLYGPDINTGTNPIEAGLDWTVRFEKGDFVGREALLKVKDKGPSRRLVGFEVEGGTIVTRDNLIYHRGKKVGAVTSGNFSPILNASLGIGYVESDLAFVGAEFHIEKDGKRMIAKVVPTPFYDPKNERLHS